MSFDQEAYEREVVRPLRGKRGKLPPPPVMYAVRPDLRDRAALEAHLKRVRAFWGQKARGNTNAGAVCKQFIAADEELKRTAGGRLADPLWWQDQFRQSADDQKAARTELVRKLREAYGASGRITRAQLTAIAQHVGGGEVAQAEAAAREAGLTVIDVLELPADCGLSRTQYDQLRDRLAEAGARTVVHLLHPGLTVPFAIARGFTVAGRPQLGLGPERITEQLEQAEKAADSTATRARKTALALLRSAYTKVPDLAAIALFHIVDQVGDAHRAGLDTKFVAAQIAELGVTEADAQLIAISLPSTGGGPERGLDRIQKLIEGRRLGEARAALAALPGDHAEHAAATELVTKAMAAFDDLLRQAADAERRHDVAGAARLLQQAGELDADNAQVLAAQERLPAPDPAQLSLAEHASPPGVRLSWAAGPGAPGGLTYRVVRGDDRPPVHETDGVRVAQSADRAAVDAGVTPGRPAHYAVFASANGTVWSRPVTGSITVLPRVGEVTLDADETSVSGSWQQHPAVIEVRVRRTRPGVGTPIRVTGHGFRDTAIRVGEPHHYELTAVYPGPGGREQLAEPVVASATPRGAARPVGDLAVEPLTTADGALRVRLTWTAGEHDEIEIRRSDRPPAWGAGEQVPAARARSFGAVLPGVPVVRGGMVTMDCAVPPGQHVYVPFSYGAGGAAVGRAVAMGVTAPVTSPQLRRTGDRIILTWLWPDDVGLAEVRWDSPRAGATFTISRAKYDAESGCPLTAPTGGGSAEIRAIAVGPTGTAQSPPVTCSIGPRATRVAYTVARPQPPSGKPLLAKLRDRVRDRARVVALASEDECHDLEVVVVAAAGVAMPMRAAQGTELARESGVHLRPGVPYPIAIEVPASFARPYWIRCFVEKPGGYAVTDPPVDQMKVS
ncbi:hypothetical protein [Actinoplanes sp. NPDC089786]|uniref:hypothetical protein n=1 Tax=Actinoplanes sp. NPDC089786 TaxID=3155185 RepID=UPI0034359B02